MRSVASHPSALVPAPATRGPQAAPFGALRQLASLALLLLAAGCTAVPPGPLEEDPRWQDVMRRGHLASRGTLYVEPPRLEQPGDLALAEAAPVTVDDDGHATFWPDRLPGGFAQELRELLKLNTGYDVTLWPEAGPPPAAAGFDYVLRLTVRSYRLDLLDVGTGSAMAALFPFGLVHLASFYNAPDETYRCELEAEVALHSPRLGRDVATQRLRGAAVLALTDFQRGWSFASYWPEQRVSWLSRDDPVRPWQEYGEAVIAACEPHARRALLIELVRFVREGTPAHRAGPGTRALLIAREAADLAAARALEAWLRAPTRPSGARPLEPARAVALLADEGASADEAQRQLWALVGESGPGDRLLVHALGALAPAEEDGRPTLRLSDRPCPLEQLLEPLRAARRRGAFPVLVLDVEGAPSAEALARLEAELDGVHLWVAPRAGGAAGPAFTTALLSALERVPDPPTAPDEADESAREEPLSLATLAAALEAEPALRPVLLGPAERTFTLFPATDPLPAPRPPRPE